MRVAETEKMFNDLADKLKGIFFWTKPIPPCDTKGDGDCGLHAMFGEWDSRDLIVALSPDAVKEKRAFVANKIRECKPGEDLYGRVLISIDTLISDTSVENLDNDLMELAALRVSASAEKEQIAAQKREAFTQALQNNADIMRELKEIYLSYSGKAWTKDDFNLFESCLQEKTNTIRELLARHKIARLYDEYQIAMKNTEVSIANILSENHDIRGRVLNVYARFIERPGNYLLVNDLMIFAILYDIKIRYWATLDAYKSAAVPNDIINPAGQKTVSIVFNGTNHYSRIVDKQTFSLMWLLAVLGAQRNFLNQTDTVGTLALEITKGFLECAEKAALRVLKYILKIFPVMMKIENAAAELLDLATAHCKPAWVHNLLVDCMQAAHEEAEPAAMENTALDQERASMVNILVLSAVQTALRKANEQPQELVAPAARPTDEQIRNHDNERFVSMILSGIIASAVSRVEDGKSRQSVAGFFISDGVSERRACGLSDAQAFLSKYTK